MRECYGKTECNASAGLRAHPSDCRTCHHSLALKNPRGFPLSFPIPSYATNTATTTLNSIQWIPYLARQLPPGSAASHKKDSGSGSTVLPINRFSLRLQMTPLALPPIPHPSTRRPPTGR